MSGTADAKDIIRMVLLQSCSSCKTILCLNVVKWEGFERIRGGFTVRTTVWVPSDKLLLLNLLVFRTDSTWQHAIVLRCKVDKFYIYMMRYSSAHT